MSSIPPLVASGLTRSYGGLTVLDGLDLVAAPGQRLGLIGENGVGKSTLLRLLAGVERPDAGTTSGPADLVHLPQEAPFADHRRVGEVLAQSLAPLHDAVRAVERLGAGLASDPTLAGPFADVLEWAERHAAWDADRRARLAAARLGVEDLDQSRTKGTLSGGQRTRLAMAAMITRRPECVLLDEPTNHLDDDAMELLESFLLDLPGVVVAASHDRAFLDAVCTHVVDLDPAVQRHGDDPRTEPVRFTGTFSEYLTHKRASRRRWEQQFTEQQERIGELRAATRIGTGAIAHNRGPRDNDRFIYAFKGANVERTHARRVHDAERRLEVAERDQVRKPPAPLRLVSELTAAGSGTSVAVQVRDLVVDARVQVRSLDLSTGGRLLVTGRNGSGKSSLLEVIAGRLAPGSGSVQVNARRIGYLEQDVTFPDSGRTPRQTYADLVGPDAAESVPVSRTGLLHPRDLDKPIADLSVGQRRRLGLALIVVTSPDLLLLDEPTNHVSLALATELEEALENAPGTVVVASHDRWLRRRWNSQTLAL